MDALAEGRDLIWNTKIDEAERLFKSKKDTNVEYALQYAEVIDYFLEIEI